jgi:ech hydrogenase subunit D
MITNVVEITREKLLRVAHDMMYNNYRFVTATCVDNGDDTLDVYYHFDKDLELQNYKLKIARGEEVPSISRVYFCAVLVENEMKELFGLNVTNMVIDYEGHLLLADDAPGMPMARPQIVIEKKEDVEK